MEHFDIVQWADFVRGLIRPADQTAMEEQLSSVGLGCGGAVRQLRKLLAVADSEARYKVPDYAVEYAKAIYPLHQPAKVHILAHTHTRLIHDSFREPLPAGIRSQGRIIRHTRYQAGDHSLDLRQEIARGHSQVILVGQITNQKEPHRQMPDVTVTMAAGKETVARAVSNEFGEFVITYEPRARLTLHVSG